MNTGAGPAVPVLAGYVVKFRRDDTRREHLYGSVQHEPRHQFLGTDRIWHRRVDALCEWQPEEQATHRALAGRVPGLTPTVSDSTPAPPTCQLPTTGTVQNLECICTTAVCGAGMANANGAVAAALRPIAAIVPPTGFSGGQTVSLQGSGSAAACGRTIPTTGYAMDSAQRHWSADTCERREHFDCCADVGLDDFAPDGDGRRRQDRHCRYHDQSDFCFDFSASQCGCEGMSHRCDVAPRG